MEHFLPRRSISTDKPACLNRQENRLWIEGLAPFELTARCVRCPHLIRITTMKNSVEGTNIPHDTICYQCHHEPSLPSNRTYGFLVRTVFVLVRVNRIDGQMRQHARAIYRHTKPWLVIKIVDMARVPRTNRLMCRRFQFTHQRRGQMQSEAARNNQESS